MQGCPADHQLHAKCSGAVSHASSPISAASACHRNLAPPPSLVLDDVRPQFEHRCQLLRLHHAPAPPPHADAASSQSVNIAWQTALPGAVVAPLATVEAEGATETMPTATATADATTTVEMIATTDDGTAPGLGTGRPADRTGIETPETEIPGATGPDPVTDRTATVEVRGTEVTATTATLDVLGTTMVGAEGAMRHQGTGMVCNRAPSWYSSPRKSPPPPELLG